MSSHVVDQPPNESAAKKDPALFQKTNGLSGVEIVEDVVSAVDSSDLEFDAPRDAGSNGHEAAGGHGAAGDEQTVISRQASQSDKPSSVSAPPAIVTSSRADLGNVLEGTSLGHFRLEKFVGGGGMGSVFRAIDMRLGRTVAVKVLSRDRTEPETLRRFQNEAQSAARLDHGNIARVYYVGEDRGVHFIVFEFIEGVNIRDLVEDKGPLPLGEAISYMLQVAEALEHASQRHVVHRDIKPSNILVTADGRAKLVDMGLARLRMESERDDLTASGVTLGTFDYISPEQARDPRIADVRSDLYSLGCTLYFMLTGRPPFPEGTLLQKLLSHSSDRPGDPRLVRPDLDEQLVEILDKLLAKQPRDRYQQPNELIGELLLVADRLQLPGLNLSGAVWVGPRQSRWTRIERTLPWLLPIVLLFPSVFALQRLWSSSGGEQTLEPPPKVTAVTRPAVRKTGAAGSQEPEKATAAEPGEADEAVDPPTKETRSAGDSSKAAVVAPLPKNTGPSGTLSTGDPAKPASPPLSKPLPESPSSEPSAPVPALPITKASGKSPAEASKPEGASALSGNATVAPKPRAASPEPASAAGKLASPGPKPAEQAASVATAAIPVTRIIVAAADHATPADAKQAVSLAAACRQAAALGVDTIELHFNGNREESAFSISSPKLSIRNGLGFRPTIVFRPGFEELAEERRMIRVGGGSLEWSGVHVRLELPADPADGWALFSLRTCDMIDLQDAVLTVCNVNAQGVLLQDRVSVLEWMESPQPASFDRWGAEEAGERAIPPYIGLSNCVVRGQATLVRCEKAVPLRISGRQCLLVLSDSLLVAGGRVSKPVQLDARIELALKQVTAVLGRGLCRLSSDTLTPFQLDLVTDCKHSILYLPDASAALIERRGVRDLAELDKHLYVRGRDNFYPGSSILLRLNPNGDPGTALTYGFTSRSESWYQEESPRFTLMWKSLPSASLPLDQHQPADYLLDQSESNPARYNGGETQAGVDVSQLPPTSDAEAAR